MALENPMASAIGGDNSSGLVTCPTCNYSVPQATGKKRTICPNCGNFYSKEAAEIASTYMRHQGRGRHSQEGAQRRRQQPNTRQTDNSNSRDDNGGGRLQVISNFFQNLGSRKSTRSRSVSSSPENSTSSLPDGLPPIENRSRSQLTVANQNQLTSYSNQNHRSTSSSRKHDSSSCGPNCVHQRHQNSKENYNGNKKHEEHLDPKLRCPNQMLSPYSASNSPNRSLNTSSPNSPGSGRTSTNDQAKGIHSLSSKTEDLLKADYVSAKETGNWRPLLEFYSTAFDSFIELNTAFKRDPSKEYITAEDPGLRFDFLNLSYDILIKTPQGLQKEVLKCIINSLLKDKRPHSKDELRAFLIILQNPQFNSQSSYVIFAHLLRQIAALTDHDHHFLVHWLKRLKKDRFQSVIERIHNFISVRLFPPKPEDLPPLSKCTWWVPSATKVMALFNAANNLLVPPIIAHIEFYNSTLDHLDLMAEYYAWQNPSSHAGFSFCQYPFVLSIAAKRTILQKDSEQQMIIMARKSLVAKVQRRQLPDIGMLFLNLTVRRSHLVSDSLNEIARKQNDLKKKLKVSFTGEPGLDMGGLTKEWFLLLVRQIFLTNYGMFTYDKESGVHWFSPNPCDNYQEFNLVGVLMGLAVYNSINLDIRFPPVCYRKLLSPAVVPFNNPRATVGVSSVALHDLKGTQSEVARGLKNLLEYEGDVEDVFCLNFEVTMCYHGTTKTVPLKPNGENISVTNDNVKEYVQLYVDWVLNKSIYSQFQAFYHGFHSVCASNALIMLRPEEVETLVCGSPKLVMEDLKKVTVYDGYSPHDPTIKYFWDVVLHLPLETQKRLLLFATGSDRIPIGGISEMTFKLSRIDDISLLPMSHTCFNQLVLPPYKHKKILKQKLITAISNAEGFGLE